MKVYWVKWWREKFPAPAGTQTPDHPARSHWAIPAPAWRKVDYKNYGEIFLTPDIVTEILLVQIYAVRQWNIYSGMECHDKLLV
jgi:hypothetical protein